MELLDSLPTAALALLIFFLRIVDVSLGTCRTIAVVQGKVGLSVLLGFVEVLVWVSTVSHVLAKAAGNPVLLLAYAAGFAAGNGVGIFLEAQLALGTVVVRIVTRATDDGLLDAIRPLAPRVLRFEGRDAGQRTSLLYAVVRRRHAPRLVEAALAVDPDLFYAVDTLRDTNWTFGEPLPGPTGWRGVMKKK